MNRTLMPNDRPKNNTDYQYIIDHYRRMGLLRRYNDWVDLSAVARFIRTPAETLDDAYVRVVEGITSAELHHVVVGESGPAISHDLPDTDLPFTRWEWVDEWLKSTRAA